jgi:hypothetical protein
MEEEKLGPNGQLSAWTPRPRLAAVTSLIAHGGPTVVAIAVSVVCSRLFPQPVGAGAFAWWVGIIAVGVLVLAALQPVARRALALSGLLHLAIEFPTPPPSRVAAAWRGSDPATVRRQLEQVHTQERSASVQTDLAVLAATLGVLEHRRRQAEVVFRVGDDDVTTRVVESDIPGFFQVVPIGSSSRKVLVTVVASTAAAALAASAALGSGSSGTDSLPTASPAGPPAASVDTTPPPEGATPSFDGSSTINPSTPSPRVGAPADDAAANPPPSTTVTPAPTPAAGGTESTQIPETAAAGGTGRTGELENSGTQASSARAATGAEPAAPGPTAFAAPRLAVPTFVVPATVPPVPAPSPVTPSPVTPSPLTASVASAAPVAVGAIAAAGDDIASTADAGPVAAFAPSGASATAEPEPTTDDEPAVVPEVRDDDGWQAGDDTKTQPAVDDPVVEAPTSETAPVPEAAGGTNDVNLDPSSNTAEAAAENPPLPDNTPDQCESEAAPISP